MLVYGTSQEKHDKSLEAVLTCLSDCNLTLNADKCEFYKTKVEFFGYVFSDQGISVDPKKVVRSFLGIVTYCGRFIPGLATLTQSVRELTKKDQLWDWSPTHQTAFDKLKNALSSDTVMVYFDQLKHTDVAVDASSVGLGAVLTQTDSDGTLHTLAYASKTLSPVEEGGYNCNLGLPSLPAISTQMPIHSGY